VAYKVFMSHNNADAAWVQWLASHAQNIGIDPYLYQHDQQPGRHISDKIQAAITESNAVVVFLTAQSQYSAYVQQEIGFAEGKGKLIIPLIQPGIRADVLAMLSGREHIPFDFHRPQVALAAFLNYLQELKNKQEANQGMALFTFATLLILALGRSK
jgi:hypothetical protein